MSYCITKTIEGQKVVILQDGQSNGRICINDKIAAVWNGEKKSSVFVAAGWEKVPTSNKTYINQRGGFVGFPRLVQYLDLPAHNDKNIKISDAIVYQGRDVLAPVNHIEFAIELIIKGDFETLKTGRVCKEI